MFTIFWRRNICFLSLPKMTEASILYLKKWLSYMTIFPSYNTETQTFESTKKKLTILLAILIGWSFGRQIAILFFGEQSSFFLMSGEFIVTLILFDDILLNTKENTKKLNVLFGYVDKMYNTNLKITEESKPTSKKLKFGMIVWNFVFLSVLTSMWSLMLANASFWFALQRFFELISFYFMQAAIVWRYILLGLIRKKLLSINQQIKQVDVKRAYSDDVHNLLDELIMQHNLIVNCVDVFNDLLGRQTLLVKIYESLQVLITLDMYLGDYFKKNFKVSAGENLLAVITTYVMVGYVLIYFIALYLMEIEYI